MDHRRFRRLKVGVAIALVVVLAANCIRGVVGIGRGLNRQDWTLLGASLFYALTTGLMVLAVLESSWWPHRKNSGAIPENNQ